MAEARRVSLELIRADGIQRVVLDLMAGRDEELDLQKACDQIDREF